MTILIQPNCMFDSKETAETVRDKNQETDLMNWKYIVEESKDMTNGKQWYMIAVYDQDDNFVGIL